MGPVSADPGALSAIRDAEQALGVSGIGQVDQTRELTSCTPDLLQVERIVWKPSRPPQRACVATPGNALERQSSVSRLPGGSM